MIKNKNYELRIKNLGVWLIYLAILPLFITHNSEFIPTAFAQSTSCIQQPGGVARVEGGLISATERGALDKFGSAEGVCAISNRANFDNPTYADLKSKFYDQAKTTSASSALTTINTTNLIQNPSFETAGANSLTPANWSLSGNFTRSADHGANTGCFTGKSAGNVTTASQIVSVTPNTTYTLSGWIFNNGGSALIDVTGGCSATTPQTQAWKQVSCTFTPSTSAVTVRVRTESANSGAWFDDVTLNAGSASPISRTSIIKYDPVATDVTQSYFNEGGDGRVVTNSVYHLKEDLTISGPITTEPKTLLIFIDKDLNINTNFTYGNSGSGVVFVVGGNINIDKDVTRIDGIFITSGTFCSATENGSCDTSDKQLIINGSVVTLNPAVSPRFVRALDDNADPAEKLNFQPKYYGLLANLFTDTVRIYAEITDPAFAFSTSISSSPAGTDGGANGGSNTVTTSYPTNNEDEACNPACKLTNASTDTWELNTYFNGQTCGAVLCDPPDGLDCAELDDTSCHGTVTGFSGSACGRVTCLSNVATYAASSGADDVCGGDNSTACNPDGSLKDYYTGTTTGSSCNQASCNYPYSPSGNQVAVCGSNNTNACNANGSLKSYYSGDSCSPTVCGFPQALDCAALDASGCHETITGHNGYSCDPTAVTCPANYDSYVGSGTNNQLAICGNNNANACNPDGTLKKYSDGSSCSPTGSCGYPYSTGGNKNGVCGVNNETSCNADGTRNKYYPGNSCTQSNCPVPTTSCTQYSNTCHGDILGYDETSCTKAVICPSNVSSYASSQGQTAICGSNNTTACNADGSRKSYYAGTLTGTTCNTATCGFPYAPSGNQVAVCGTNNATSCNANGTVKQYYSGSLCSAQNCGFPAKTATPTNSCHGDVYGYNGFDCVWRLIYPSTYLTPTTCSSTDGCSSPAGGSQLTYIPQNSCSGTNCPLSTTQSRCPADGCSSPAGGSNVTFHTGASCAATNCPINETASSRCSTACTPTPNNYHNGTSCGAISCPNNYTAPYSLPSCRAPNNRPADYSTYGGWKYSSGTQCGYSVAADNCGYCGGNGCLTRSQFQQNYGGAGGPSTFYWIDSWANGAITYSSSWNTGGTPARSDGCDDGYGTNHDAVDNNFLNNEINGHLNQDGITRSFPYRFSGTCSNHNEGCNYDWEGYTCGTSHTLPWP